MQIKNVKIVMKQFLHRTVSHFVVRLLKMSKITFLFVFLSVFSLDGLNGKRMVESPIVSTPLGQIEGTVNKSFFGKEYFSFRGIPFAEPPTGDFRFKVHLLSI